MRTLITVIVVVSLSYLSSCNSATTPGNQTTTLTSKTLTVVPDSISDYYFSFDAEKALDTAQKTGTGWDVKINHVFGGGRTMQIDIFCNSGTVNPAGQTKAYVVDSTFDKVSFADASKLRVDSLSSSGRIASVDLSGSGMFTYDPATHSIAPNPQKTLIIRTASGTFAKLQFVSLAVTASRFELAPFVIRYLKGDGTRLQ